MPLGCHGVLYAFTDWGGQQCSNFDGNDVLPDLVALVLLILDGAAVSLRAGWLLLEHLCLLLCKKNQKRYAQVSILSFAANKTNGIRCAMQCGVAGLLAASPFKTNQKWLQNIPEPLGLEVSSGTEET